VCLRRCGVAGSSRHTRHCGAVGARVRVPIVWGPTVGPEFESPWRHTYFLHMGHIEMIMRAILTLQSGSDLSPTVIATDIIIVRKSVTRGGVHGTDFKPSFRSSDGLNAFKLINMFNV
jgi:hypothetical protein